MILQFDLWIQPTEESNEWQRLLYPQRQPFGKLCIAQSFYSSVSLTSDKPALERANTFP